MTSSVKEDQDQRKSNGIEDSETRIEFLRARLLAERSVSRAARQRADELAQRVSELEEQLKIVSLQRKKAEKATAAVLSILENHEISDASEEYNSDSDQETDISVSKDDENKKEGKETLSSVKEKENDADTISSSEIESSSSASRSLSWKSGRGSLHSLDRRKYTDSNRRRSSNFASSGISSPRLVGKSCRRISRRDTRSASNELQKSSAACASEALPNSANNGPRSLVDGAGNSDANGQLQLSASSMSENGRGVEKSEEEMQRALHQQAQLIGQYEDEEKAQREWEEKYGENNSYTPDSCDPENYSDVTEERDDSKASQQPCLAGKIDMQNHVNKYGSAVVLSTRENASLSNSASTPPVHMGCSKDEKVIAVGSDSPASLSNQSQSSAHSQHQSFPTTHSPARLRRHTASSSGASSSGAGLHFQRGYELALVSPDTFTGVGSVLGALEQAKLSIGKQIISAPPSRAGSSIRAMEPSIPATRISERPADYPALFRVPTHFQLEATTTNSYPGFASRYNPANYSPEPSAYKLSGNPYMEPRSDFPSLPSRPLPSSAPLYRPETTIDAGLTSPMSFNHSSSSHLPFTSKFAYPSYPMTPDVMPASSSSDVFSRNLPRDEKGLPPKFSFSTPFPDGVPKLLPGDEAFSRNLSKNETGIPPSFSVSRYNTHVRPNMYS